MAVNISGSVLASLLYDHAQSEGHQMGFLTGQVVSHMKDTISDSQINNYEVETKIYIYGTVACPRDQRFYNKSGQILTDQIEALLQKEAQNIVGWYSFRRNSTMRPSLMERLVHENLLRLKKQDSSHFVFLLCTSKISSNKSTHSFDHSFSCLQHRNFQRKLVNVINLGDTTHTEYKSLPSHTASTNHGIYSLIVEQQEDNFLDAHGQMEVRQIQSLNGALSRKLDEISVQVAESETKLSSLEEEVHMYRKQVRLKTLENEQKQNSVPPPSTSVPKTPSIDEILSMDTSDGDIPVPIQQDPQPRLLPGTSPKIEITRPKDVSQSTTKGEHSGKTSVKTDIKLTSPASLHNRSNSMSNDKTFSENSINTAETIHVRSKSADVPDNKNKGQSATSKDPFSFVSNMMAQEEVNKGRHAKTDKSVPSDTNEPKTRLRSRNVEAASEAAKNINFSARTHSRKHSKNTEDINSEIKNDKDLSDDSEYKADTDSGGSDAGNRAINKTNLIGSKACSQEVGKKVGVSDDNQSEDSSSQDTFDMEISSSPIY